MAPGRRGTRRRPSAAQTSALTLGTTEAGAVVDRDVGDGPKLRIRTWRPNAKEGHVHAYNVGGDFRL